MAKPRIAPSPSFGTPPPSLFRLTHVLTDPGKSCSSAGTSALLVGLKVASGTIVDVTIIAAPSSTKNATKVRHPEMPQIRMRGR
jgi:hypothetical protein